MLIYDMCRVMTTTQAFLHSQVDRIRDDVVAKPHTPAKKPIRHKRRNNILYDVYYG